MNNKLNTIILPIFFFAFLSLGEVQGQECYSSLEIKTSGIGILIYLENEFIGTDSAKIELEKGMYELLLISREREWDTKAVRDTININRCDSTYVVSKEIPVKIYFNTNPANAYVFGNDTLLGSTPLFLHKKYLSLRLEKPNYETKEIHFPPPDPNIGYNLNFIGKTDKEKFLDSHWFKVLFGSAIILGSAAAYYKVKADNEFEIYRRNGNKSNLDTTERYDLYSGTAFGLLQVNFAALLYFFLTD